jgi:hypothetical protein
MGFIFCLRSRVEGRTVVELARRVVGVALQFDVEQPGTWCEGAGEGVAWCAVVITVPGRLDKPAGLVLQAAAAGEAASFSEDAQEFLVREACCCGVVGAHFARENVREGRVEFDELARGVDALLFKGCQDRVGFALGDWRC